MLRSRATVVLVVVATTCFGGAGFIWRANVREAARDSEGPPGPYLRIVVGDAGGEFAWIQYGRGSTCDAILGSQLPPAAREVFYVLRHDGSEGWIWVPRTTDKRVTVIGIRGNYHLIRLTLEDLLLAIGLIAASTPLIAVFFRKRRTRCE